MGKNKNETLLRKVYILLFILMVSIPIIITFTRTGSANKIYENNYEDISNDWLLSGTGENIKYSEFGKRMDPDKGVISIYYQLPDKLTGNCIMYHSKDVYTSVYVEDELIYETKCYKSSLYNESPGNLWNTVKLEDRYAGKIIRMDIRMVYDTKSVCVDSIRMGDKMNIVIGFAMSKKDAIMISLAMMIAGLTIAIINLYTLFDKNMPKTGNFALAAFAVIIGMWCFLETNVLQIYIEDGRLIQLIDNMCMFIGTLPVLFYLDSFYHILKSRIIRIFCWIDIAILTFCFMMQVTNISDFHHYISFAWITFGIFVVIMIVNVSVSIWKRIKSNTLEIAHVMHITGFVLLMLAGVGPGFKYMAEDTLDRAGHVRVGVFLFILCSAVGGQIQNSRKMGKAIKYDLVKNLAYKDGLTGLNNRTSYLEQLSEYEHKGITKLGIVFLDINNLKLVNDRNGHSAGDKYITQAAELIRNSFGEFGPCYRIGGDEFCVFMEGIDVVASYKDALKKFEDQKVKYQENKAIDIQIEIAIGFEIYTSDSGETLSEVIKIADNKMYENKAKMKRKA